MTIPDIVRVVDADAAGSAIRQGGVHVDLWVRMYDVERFKLEILVLHKGRGEQVEIDAQGVPGRERARAVQSLGRAACVDHPQR